MDRFSKYIGKNARLKDGSLVTIIDVLEDDKSDKPLFYVKYDNGSVDSVYSNYIQNIIEDEPEVEDNEDINGDENIEDDGIDPVDVDNEDEMDEVEINNRIFSGESRMKKFNENYSVAELSDIFNNKQERVQTMKDLADDDRMTGILLDFGGEVEPEVTDVDDFVDAMILPFREALINKANSLIEEKRMIEMKNRERGGKMVERKERKPITEGRATTFGFAGETIKVNDPVMDISTNRQGFVKSIHENGDAEIDFSGKKETHKIRTFMKI